MSRRHLRCSTNLPKACGGNAEAGNKTGVKESFADELWISLPKNPLRWRSWALAIYSPRVIHAEVASAVLHHWESVVRLTTRNPVIGAFSPWRPWPALSKLYGTGYLKMWECGGPDLQCLGSQDWRIFREGYGDEGSWYYDQREFKLILVVRLSLRRLGTLGIQPRRCTPVAPSRAVKLTHGSGCLSHGDMAFL